MQVDTSTRQIQTAPLLDFPIEILEHICHFLLTDECEIDDSSKPWGCEDRHLLPGWRANCIAFRSTCKLFESLSTPPAALFYTAQAFTTKQSILKLEAVANHPRFAPLVKCVAFITPCLSESKSVNTLLYNWVGDGGLDAEQRFNTARSLYRKLLTEQRKFFVYVYRTNNWKDSGPYYWAKALEKFVNVRRLLISNADHTFETSLGHKQGNHLARNYPDLLIEEQSSHNPVHNWWSNDYLAGVFQAICRSRVSPSELVCGGKCQGRPWGLESSWDWNDHSNLLVPSMFSNLRKLKLNLLATEDDVPYKDWTDTVLPILEKTTLLDDLHLSAYESDPELNDETPRFALSLSEVALPKLRAVHLHGFYPDGRDLSIFLSRHAESIHYLCLETFHMKPRTYQTEPCPWKMLCDTIRQMRLDCGTQRRYHVKPLLLRKSWLKEKLEAAATALLDYIEGKGEWTKTLSTLCDGNDWEPDEEEESLDNESAHEESLDGEASDEQSSESSDGEASDEESSVYSDGEA